SGEELHVALRAAARLAVARLFPVAASLAAADVAVAGDEACAAEGAPEHVLELGVPRPHLPVLGGKHQVRARDVDRLFQEGPELTGDGEQIGVAALGRFVIVAAAHGDGAADKVDVVLLKSEQLPLAPRGP